MDLVIVYILVCCSFYFAQFEVKDLPLSMNRTLFSFLLDLL